MVDRLEHRVFLAGLEVSACHKRIRDLEKESRKEKRQPPRKMMEKLRDELKSAKLGVYQAEAALDGARRFPPIR